MQLGFVIDQSRCIGCHACTVACKSENDVPIGSFRTWVKYTESGEFPEVKRTFGVLRCNQCSGAPCTTICPVTAIYKRESDGIVDIDRTVCIGCKACMQGCPYDAIYLNESSGVAEKCHFCAHRTEMGLAPACAVVCPTEAIIPGDFDDPTSVVSQMKNDDRLTARKVEAGTGPNVLYKEAHASVLDPTRTSAAGGSIWSDVPNTLQWASEKDEAHFDMEAFLEQAEARAKSRTVYDTRKPLLWGTRVSTYMFTKSISGGVFFAGAFAGVSAAASAWTAALALFFLTLTGLILIADLKRPERFWLILRRPNWDSWLARGTVVLMAYGGLLTLWLALLGLGVDPDGIGNGVLTLLTSVAGLLTAIYTAWLFAQARGRPLWMKRGLTLQLAAQSAVAGSAALFLAAPLLGLEMAHAEWGRFLFQGSLLYFLFLL